MASAYKARLLARLDAIGAALDASGKGLALLALGSVGVELERLDAYSDLDFFAIVRAGSKAAFMDDLNWMAAPIAYRFRNTEDGYKVLYEDGIYAEFAIFELDDLAAIPFAPGRVVWKAPDFDETLVAPRVRTPGKPSVEHALGEALTNLYVGLGRYHRGEKMAAMHLIQIHALNQVMRLAPYVEPDHPDLRDQFADERRFERRFPGIAARLPEMVQGYARSPESARAILAFLSEHFEVDAAIAARILELCDNA